MERGLVIKVSEFQFGNIHYEWQMEELKQLLLPIVVKDCKNLATNEFLRLEFLSQISSFNFRWVSIQAKRKGSKIIWPLANFYESSKFGYFLKLSKIRFYQ